MKNHKKAILLVLLAVVLVSTAGYGAYLAITPSTTPAVAPAPQEMPQPQADTPEEPKAYLGLSQQVGEAFSVRVPNGWNASISLNPTFMAIMFASPGAIASLTYNETIPASVGTGIAPWSGLTEHFFILAPTASAHFDPAEHEQVTETSFTFDDGTVGTKYTVIKGAEEAKKWNGLLKDTEWQGRVYVYETAAGRVEAHLAIYPSTSIDLAFFEDVARTITQTPAEP